MMISVGNNYFENFTNLSRKITSDGWININLIWETHSWTRFNQILNKMKKKYRCFFDTHKYLEINTSVSWPRTQIEKEK